MQDDIILIIREPEISLHLNLLEIIKCIELFGYVYG